MILSVLLWNEASDVASTPSNNRRLIQRRIFSKRSRVPTAVTSARDLDDPLLVVDYESPNSSDLRVVAGELHAASGRSASMRALGSLRVIRAPRKIRMDRLPATFVTPRDNNYTSEREEITSLCYQGANSLPRSSQVAPNWNVSRK